MATLVAITVINAWRLLYIYQKMDIQPLQPKMLIVVILAFVAYFAAAATPSVSYPILTILLKGLVLTLVYGSGIVYFKVSDDVNRMVKKIVNI